ncbi:olfactomedin-like protein 1 [Platysternon megacephalum]|uniref:Olfactomedin-like protein 1 n=1 Tax=Platysternon megacephalum TaxID=55544 RepID=A0A4D9DY98_9SAUR|nr:olfactomedin-like protein 1 [Platysternon megacephalum]
MGCAGIPLPCLLVLGASLQLHLQETLGDAPAAGLRSPAGESDGQAPLVRVRRTTGLLSGAAYVTLAPLAPGTMDAAQIQPLLGALPVPRPLAGSAGNITALGVSTGTASPTAGPQLIPAGGALTISFSLGAGASEVTWYLLSPDGSSAREIRNGTQTMLVTNGSVAVLRVSSISADWAGEYICHYVYENSQMQLRQQVSVSLGPEDIAQTPAQVSMNCSSSGGINLRCCIRNRGKAYRVSWVPGSRAPADLVGDTDPLCHSLPLETCPAQDTLYQCVFESEGLGTAQAVVTVSVIQAGDPFCPSNDSQGTWTATKAGRVAEISCPDNRAGTVQRSCSTGGVWGEVITKCTHRELLAGLRSAQLVLAGLGNPRSELARLIEWLRAGTQPGRGSVSSASDLLAVVTTVDTISRIAGDAGLHLGSSTMAVSTRDAALVGSQTRQDVGSPHWAGLAGGTRHVSHRVLRLAIAACWESRLPGTMRYVHQDFRPEPDPVHLQSEALSCLNEEMPRRKGGSQKERELGGGGWREKRWS